MTPGEWCLTYLPGAQRVSAIEKITATAARRSLGVFVTGTTGLFVLVLVAVPASAALLILNSAQQGHGTEHAVAATDLLAPLKANTSPHRASSPLAANPSQPVTASQPVTTPATPAPNSAPAVTITGIESERNGTLGAEADVSFTATNSSGSASQFSVTVNWGDDTSSVAQVSARTGGGFEAEGSHHYAAAGTYTITITVNVSGGTGASKTTQVTVS